MLLTDSSCKCAVLGCMMHPGPWFAVAAAERASKSAEAVLDQLQTRRVDALKSATMDQVRTEAWPTHDISHCSSGFESC